MATAATQAHTSSAGMPPALSAHRYAHLYPPESFFRIDDDPQRYAAGHSARFSMVWAMLRGEQPPLHLFGATAHAARIHAGQAAQQQQEEQQSIQQHSQQLAAQTEPQQEHFASPAQPASSANQDEPMQCDDEAAAASSPSLSFPSASTYTREQLLSLFRPAVPLPPPLAAVALACTASPADAWLAQCISITALAPVSASPADALQSALQDELCRDAANTGVSEYAGEWWLPTYADISHMKRGSNNSSVSGRGGGSVRGGGRGRGRGRGGRGGGGYQPEPPVQLRYDPPPASLGGGRKSKKRPAPAESDQQNGLISKRLYSDSNISKLFIGPAAPPSRPAISAAVVAQSIPAASNSAPAAASSLPSLPSKREVFDNAQTQSAAAANHGAGAPPMPSPSAAVAE